MLVSNLASAECFIRWRSVDASHTDWKYFPKLDFRRDVMPEELGRMLREAAAEPNAEVSIEPDEAIPSSTPAEAATVAAGHLSRELSLRGLGGPFRGRFYPRGLLVGCTGIRDLFSPKDPRPFRVRDMDGERVTVDLKHPLSGVRLSIGGRVVDELGSKEEHGGHCNDLPAELCDRGPGMQCRAGTLSLEFDARTAFERDDPNDDGIFYQEPRFVHHVDAQARETINGLYRRFVKPGDRILDLMSSWTSHLDGIPDSACLAGLGMNAAELAGNERLSDFRVQDLNRDRRLPFGDDVFDLVFCSLSVEYLTSPVEVFADVARVLRPGGRFVLTFSDRWFPPKAIRIWSELHPFERMGLVLDFFRLSGRFGNLNTESFRGWPRPADDKYFRQLQRSDPVFAVWATAR